MTEKFIKDTLKVVVGQICQTIGWNSINSSVMEILIDVLRRYLLEIARTTHNFSDLFGRTRPNIDDLGLAFSEMGIDVRELREYVQFVESAPCNLAVPKFPVFKESHLNFLKPGSKEVVTRPVHVNEHLPPTVELTVETNSDLTSSPQPSPTFKRPGDPVDNVAKRARLGLEEEGRPLREISSVMMTTGGFISPAREGKLPEPKWTLPVSDLRSQSPPAPHYPSVPKEIFREKKKRPPDSKPKERSKKVRRSSGSGSKKLANMKEVAKLKAFKSNASKVHSSHPHPHRPPSHTPEKSLIQKLSESPHLVVTPVPSEPPPPVVKLATEPDKQKLNIFKKISKVKEEEPPLPPPPPPIKEIETVFSSPGSPSTPKTPDILRSPEHKKKKKDKEKKKKRQDQERVRSDSVETDRRPKTPEMVHSPAPPAAPAPPFPAPFSFFPPGQLPLSIANPLIPRFPLPLGPNFPNLPLPPHFMHPAAKSEAIVEPPMSTSKSPLAILLDREKKGKEHKKDKKEKKKKDRKDKPKKDKKEKRHGEEKHKSKDKKEKKEKRKEKEREREREKEREKEKDREKEKEREKEREKEKEKEREKLEKVKEKIKEETPVPKLTLKIAPSASSPRPASPRRHVEEEPRRSAPKPSSVEEPKRSAAKPIETAEPRAEGSEIAKISSLFSKPTKSETKQLHVQTESLKIPKEIPLQKSPGTIIDADGNKVWICPACGKPDDGTPMIGCDECDAWYHWVCVGIHVAPEENDDWYCRFCIVKKQGSSGRKKRGRKKKERV